MKSTIKQILREDADKTITCEKCGWHWKESETTKNDMYNCHKCGKDNTPKLKESLTRNDINNYLLDFGYFITLNLSKIQSEAIDQNAQIALKKMQERLRAPIINGKTFIDITDLNKTLKSELFKPEFIKGVLTQIRAFLPYIKQHIERFVKDGHYKTAWLSRIDNLEKGYINIVNQPKPVNEHLKANQLFESIRRKVLKEYLSQDMVSLYQYFKTSREDREKYLPYEYPYQFDQFAIEYKLQDLKDKFEEEGIETYEIPDILESEYPEVLEQFGKWLYMMIEDGDLGENKASYPTWYFFDDAKVVKNQWLIHFTNDADSIAIEGFTRGVNEMDKLGLTTHFGDFYKKYGGYNFAYKVEDYAKYAHSNRSFGGYKFKYGKEAVIFNASGLRLWHNGDEEPQVIFFGNTAKNIIPIVEGENSTWSVRNAKTNRVIFENDNFDKVVQWVINNFIQYKNAI